MLTNTFEWMVGSVVAAELRFEFIASQFVFARYILVGLLCAVLQIGVGLIFGHYHGRHPHARSAAGLPTCQWRCGAR